MLLSLVALVGGAFGFLRLYLADQERRAEIAEAQRRGAEAQEQRGQARE